MRPLAKIYFGTCWFEALCPLVEVKRRVGHARGIDTNENRHYVEKHNSWKSKRSEVSQKVDKDPWDIYLPDDPSSDTWHKESFFS